MLIFIVRRFFVSSLLSIENFNLHITCRRATMRNNHSAIPVTNLSIPALFQQRVKDTPSSPAYHFFDHFKTQWRTLTWAEMEKRVSQWSAALDSEELRPGDRVALMIPNGINWVCFDLAAQSLGLIVVPLFANDRPENVSYILEHTSSKLLLCNDSTFWQELSRLQKADTKKRPQRVIIAEPGDKTTYDQGVTDLDDWLAEAGAPAEYKMAAPDDLATIVYTSGTTGRPKGVMLSHRNILENAAGGLTSITIMTDDVFLSFLPLSHMLERTIGYYLPMIAGSSIAYARSIQDLSEDLVTIKPTVLIAVPRIFEKLHNKLMIGVNKQSSLMRWLFKLAITIGWRSHLYRQHRQNWSPNMLFQPILNRLVGKKVQARLGGKLRVVISGGAALSYEIAQKLIGLGLPIYQGYGLTESSPVISVNRVDSNYPDTVGLPLPGVSVKLSEDGELLVRGSSVMQGYWRNPEATAEVIDSEGWLHTGDITALIGDHLKIIGRMKDILVLSNSEKISPTDMETAIGSDPLFEQSMIIGEGRPYLTLLAVLNQEMWQQLATTLDISTEDSSLADEQVRAEIMKRVEQCLQSFPGYAWIKNISLSLKPWTVEQGMLTPTMKLRRKNILSAMEDEIDRMYQT